jgi:hypothetical protein
LCAGAEKLTVALVFPATAPMPAGAPGTVAGATGVDAADAGPIPALLAAVTEKA